MGMEWFKKKGWDKWFQRDNLIILVLTGILLFIIALPTKEDEGKKVSDNSEGISYTQTKRLGEESVKSQSEEESRQLSGESDGSLDYADYLEKRLKKMLEGVDGVGQVSV